MTFMLHGSHTGKPRNKERRDGIAETKKKMDCVKGGGEILNGLNRKGGRANRRYLRTSEYRLLPKLSRRGTSAKISAPVSSPPKMSTRPPFSPIPMESPAEVQEKGLPSQEDSEEACAQSFSATSDLSGQFSAADADSVMVLGAGATANLVCLNGWAAAILCRGIPSAKPFRARARFKFGNGRLCDLRFWSDILLGIAGGRG